MTVMERDNTLLIDGNHLAHRCRHTFSLSWKGVDVSVTYGFIKTLCSLIHKFNPHSVLVCWDGGIPEFRRQLIPSYKSNRHKDEDEIAWEDFQRQMNELDNYALPILGIATAKKVGAEADDLLYHASRVSYHPCIIVTGDRDLIQAVDYRTIVYSPTKNITYTVDNIKELTGVELHQLVHWKALQGDGSDNIPGVVGIGEKTATKLFNEFGDIASIVNAALGINPNGRLSGKLAENIRAFGLVGLGKNTQAMALYRDMVGARMAVLNCNHTPYSTKRAKAYFMSRGFVSLLDYMGDLNGLNKPEFRSDERYPVIAGIRKPL